MKVSGISFLVLSSPKERGMRDGRLNPVAYNLTPSKIGVLEKTIHAPLLKERGIKGCGFNQVA